MDDTVVENEVSRTLAGLASLVNQDEALIRRGRFVNLSFRIGVGHEAFLIAVAAGRLISVTPCRLATDTGIFGIHAAPDTWAKHWSPVPPRDFHDLFAMLPRRLAWLEGDLRPLMRNLQYFKDVMAKPRRSA